MSTRRVLDARQQALLARLPGLCGDTALREGRQLAERLVAGCTAVQLVRPSVWSESRDVRLGLPDVVAEGAVLDPRKGVLSVSVPTPLANRARAELLLPLPTAAWDPPDEAHQDAWVSGEVWADLESSVFQHAADATLAVVLMMEGLGFDWSGANARKSASGLLVDFVLDTWEDRLEERMKYCTQQFAWRFLQEREVGMDSLPLAAPKRPAWMNAENKGTFLRGAAYVWLHSRVRPDVGLEARARVVQTVLQSKKAFPEVSARTLEASARATYAELTTSRFTTPLTGAEIALEAELVVNAVKVGGWTATTCAAVVERTKDLRLGDAPPEFWYTFLQHAWSVVGSIPGLRDVLGAYERLSTPGTRATRAMPRGMGTLAELQNALVRFHGGEFVPAKLAAVLEPHPELADVGLRLQAQLELEELVLESKAMLASSWQQALHSQRTGSVFEHPDFPGATAAEAHAIMRAGLEILTVMAVESEFELKKSLSPHASEWRLELSSLGHFTDGGQTIHVVPTYEPESLASRVRDALDDLSAAGSDAFRVKLMALPEPFKVRIISKGPGLLYWVGRVLQHAIHSCLGKTRWARFTHLPADLSLAAALSAASPPGVSAIGTSLPECAVHGDYSASTDRLSPMASALIVLLLADRMNLSPEWTGLFMRGLIDHRIMDPDSPARAPEYKDQSWGQLMGSPLSFPVLCIANMTLTSMGLHVGIPNPFVHARKPPRKSGRKHVDEDTRSASAIFQAWEHRDRPARAREDRAFGRELTALGLGDPERDRALRLRHRAELRRALARRAEAESYRLRKQAAWLEAEAARPGDVTQVSLRSGKVVRRIHLEGPEPTAEFAHSQGPRSWPEVSRATRGEIPALSFRFGVPRVSINGDDVFFLASRDQAEYWYRTTAWGGLSPSAGKNYVTAPGLAGLNSQLFVARDNRWEVIGYYNVAVLAPPRFVSQTEFYLMGPAFQEKLLRMAALNSAAELDRLNSMFLAVWAPMLSSFPGNWFIPRDLGGFGLRYTRPMGPEGPSDSQLDTMFSERHLRIAAHYRDNASLAAFVAGRMTWGSAEVLTSTHVDALRVLDPLLAAGVLRLKWRRAGDSESSMVELESLLTHVLTSTGYSGPLLDEAPSPDDLEKLARSRLVPEGYRLPRLPRGHDPDTYAWVRRFDAAAGHIRYEPVKRSSAEILPLMRRQLKKAADNPRLAAPRWVWEKMQRVPRRVELELAPGWHFYTEGRGVMDVVTAPFSRVSVVPHPGVTAGPMEALIARMDLSETGVDWGFLDPRMYAPLARVGPITLLQSRGSSRPAPHRTPAPGRVLVDDPLLPSLLVPGDPSVHTPETDDAASTLAPSVTSNDDDDNHSVTSADTDSA